MPSPTDPAVRGLPAPTPEEESASAALTDRIRAEIELAGGAIDFGRFMQLALYAPGLGYYASGRSPFGARGDFVTAPEIGTLFARCLARQCREILARLGGGTILEAGAGSGALAAALLLELERLGALPERYLILELSATLAARQHATLAERAPQLRARVEWLTALPRALHGVVLANELLDALPVERFRVGERGIEQLQVGWEAGQFAWRTRPADAAIAARVAPLALPAGYASEVGLQAEAWVRSVGGALARGALLLVDYGFPRTEFYHPQRAHGTLMCHYRHRAHADPLTRVGLQDVSAHVDFTAIADAGLDAGLEVLGYTGQAMFLLGNGLAELASTSDPDDVAAHARLAHEVQLLSSPAEMGELFKAIALGRGLDGPLAGFALQDRRARL